MNSKDNNKIDILVQKLIKLKPTKFHEIGSQNFYLFYGDSYFNFYNMSKYDYTDVVGIVKIDNYEKFFINNETRLLVLGYFDKHRSVDDIMLSIDKTLRNKKINKINGTKR